MDRARERIQATDILKKVLAYICADPMAEDPRERPEAIMTDGQARAAFALLKKVLPDIASQTIQVQVMHDRPVREVTLDQLMNEWEERLLASQQVISGESTRAN
jgi:hypothetical protein